MRRAVQFAIDASAGYQHFAPFINLAFVQQTLGQPHATARMADIGDRASQWHATRKKKDRQAVTHS
jgi:hypothetical protein